MRLLLDTHAWIYAATRPDRLSAAARSALSTAGAEVLLSPISVWEATLLAERGRVRVDDAPAAWVRDLLRLTPATMAPLTHEVALRSREIAYDGADPADRFLAATALVHDAVLVTADERLRAAPSIPTLW
jgi:PIN domain nuclease of toxin-antitoxin system